MEHHTEERSEYGARECIKPGIPINTIALAACGGSAKPTLILSCTAGILVNGKGILTPGITGSEAKLRLPEGMP